MTEAWIRQEYTSHIRTAINELSLPVGRVVSSFRPRKILGIVLLEAFASGVPAVVSSHGYPKLLVKSGVTGFVADFYRDFVSGVYELITDRVLQGRMRQARREYALKQS